MGVGLYTVQAAGGADEVVLNSYFDIYGVNFFVRVLRDGCYDYENEDFLTIPTPIEKGEVIKITRVYNYFIFKLKIGRIIKKWYNFVYHG